MNPCIVIEDLVVKHGRSRALDGLSFQVQEGSVTALLGRNGAGKSTLLDCLIGLLPPSSGRVRVLGRDPWKEGPRLRQDIGYVEADPWFEAHEGLTDLMRFFRSMHPNWSDAEAQRLAKSFDLDLGKRVKELSRGMRTKLALVLALAHRPKLLVLDEPFDGLDCGVRDEILAEVVRQVDDERSIIIASHDLDEIERVADEVVVLHEGKVVFAAEIEAMRARTRRYLGRTTATFRPENVAGAASIERLGHELKLTFFADIDVEALEIEGVEDLRPLPTADLKEAFLAATGGDKRREAI